MFAAFFKWLSRFVPEVPEEMAACEFECHKTECLMGDWLKCERRQQAMSRDWEKRQH